MNNQPIDETADPDAVKIQAIKDRAQEARVQYELQRGLYHDFATDVARLIEACLRQKNIQYQAISAREKDPASFERKAAKASDDDPTVAKYANPIDEITDKAAVRVTTYFLETIDRISDIINTEFVVIERSDKAPGEPDRLGYQSIHYLVQHLPRRADLAEYQRFAGLTAEVQVRTVLQHAWAEIDHDIQYKAVTAVPERIRRRFTALAGLIEIADREFQAIADENSAIRTQARIDIDSGNLDQVELTSDSLREYLDKKYGPDGRMRDWSYDFAVRHLLSLGFTNLGEVDASISGYDDDAVSRAVYGTRLGQVSRFEFVLLASMGDNYIMGHPWVSKDDVRYVRFLVSRLKKFADMGIIVGDYRPAAYSGRQLSAVELADIKASLEGETAGSGPATMPDR